MVTRVPLLHESFFQGDGEGFICQYCSKYKCATSTFFSSRALLNQPVPLSVWKSQPKRAWTLLKRKPIFSTHELFS